MGAQLHSRGHRATDPRDRWGRRISTPDQQEATVTTRTATRGVLYVHSAPSALCPHIEWAVGGVLGNPVNLEWTPQGAQAGAYRAEFSWTGEAGTGAAPPPTPRRGEHPRFRGPHEPPG